MKLPWMAVKLLPDILLQDFLCQIERYCRQCHLTTPITFPPEHPVEEVGRLLLCCLLKHEDLGMKLNVHVFQWYHRSFSWHARHVHSYLTLLLNVFTGHVALSLVHAGTLGIEQVKHRTLPKTVVDVCRVVHQAKCSLIKVNRFEFFHGMQPVARMFAVSLSSPV